jgi:hypothetical protein
MTLRKLVVVSAAVLALVIGTVGLGGGGGSTPSPIAQIKQNWTAFFNGSTPVSKKVQLLENGQRFAPLLQAQASSPLASQAQAIVTKITMQGPNRAQVVYTISVAGSPALKNQTGTAVRVGGVWRISDHSFCALLTLEGAAPPMCRGL